MCYYLLHMNKKGILFKKVITFKNERCDVKHVNVDDFSNIPDNLIEKSHAVCIHNGKLLVVFHPKWNIWSIPGGSREDGENIIDTLKREVLEETNCIVESWKPISYQKIKASTGDTYYRALYLCEVIPDGDFVEDIAGNITGIKWIDLEEYTDYIEDKPFKLEVLRRGLEVYNK
ncbi:MAG: ADP-ribose pyrophosphatase YjhB (NUDIX family) [Candidatus Paceibacteria bacterium]|jgi:ADP-ribose pyrophosphatase YjhB (NUDIX family)